MIIGLLDEGLATSGPDFVDALAWQRDYGLQQPMVEAHERFAEAGLDFWTGYTHVPITVGNCNPPRISISAEDPKAGVAIRTGSADAEPAQARSIATRRDHPYMATS